MRRVILILLILILSLTGTSIAESVTRYSYDLMIGDTVRSGVYTGEIRDGKPDGFGVFETVNDDGYKWHYIGTWKAGLMDGSGAIYWEDGALEEGEYKNGDFVSGYFNYDSRVLAYASENGGIRTMPAAEEVQYVGNKNSKKFHLANCEYAEKMSSRNKVEFTCRQEAIDLEYEPCNACKP